MNKLSDYIEEDYIEEAEIQALRKAIRKELERLRDREEKELEKFLARKLKEEWIEIDNFSIQC